MTGVEAQGVEFILRFRDEASTQISMAETAYNSLVSAMQKVLQTEKAFSEAAVDSLSRTSAAMKRAGGSALVTPLTVDPSRMQLISQFEQISTQWFRDIGVMYSKYLAQVRSAVMTTGTMRDIVVELGQAAKEGSGGIDSFFKVARRFTTLKFSDGSFGDALRNIQDIVRVLLEMEPASKQAAEGLKQVSDEAASAGASASKSTSFIERLLLALQKGLKGRETTQAAQGVGQVGKSVEELGKHAQGASFHMLDVRDGIRKAGQEADSKNGMFGNLGKTLGNLKKSFGDIATVAQLAFSAVVSGKAVQTWSNMEDAVFRIKHQTGELSLSTAELTREMAMAALKGKVTQETFVGVTEATAKLTGSIRGLSTETRTWLSQFSEMYEVSPELAAQAAIKFKQVGHLTETETVKMMAMMEQFTRGSKLNAAEWTQTFSDMTDLTRRLASSYAMTEKEVMFRLYPAIFKGMRAFQDVFGDPEVMFKAIRSTLSMANDDFKQMTQLLATAGVSAEDMRRSLATGDIDTFIKSLRTAVQYWDQMGIHGQTSMEALAGYVGMTVEQLHAVAQINDDILKNAGKALDPSKALEQHKRVWEDYNQTFSKRWSNFQEGLKYYALNLFPILDTFILKPLEKLSDLLRWIAEKDLKIFGVALNDLISISMGFFAAWAGSRIITSFLGSIRSALGLTSVATKEATVSTGLLARAQQYLSTSMKGAQTQATLTTGSILGLSKANDAVIAKGAATTAAAAGRTAAAIGLISRATTGLFAAWAAWEGGKLIGDLALALIPGLDKLDRIMTNWVAEHAPKFLDLFNFSGYSEKYREYFKELESIRKQYGDKAAEDFVRKMKSNQGFDSMTMDQFKGFMSEQKTQITQQPQQPNATPSAALSAAPYTPEAPASPSPVQGQEGPVFVDPATGKTTYVPSSRPPQTTVDDIRDERTSVPAKDPEIAELLRESNAHLKWLREYAAMVSSSQKSAGRSSVFVQGL